MGFLAGKRFLITGVLNNRSIAYGIARACHREGAELAFSYQGERFKDRITEFAADFGSKLVFECDVADDAQIAQLFAQLGESWEQFDGFVHAIAFAPREAIAGDFLDGFTRENFRIAHDISAYSFPAMAKAAAPRLRTGAALLTLTYLGAVRYVPNYNLMGLAKASLESSVRFLAQSLGSRGVRLHHCRAFLADLRGTHRAEGRSKGGATGQQLRDYALVIERVFRHAQTAGVSPAAADILARLLFAASRKCAAAGYEVEARRCLELAECAARPWRRRRIAGYGALSALAGWSPVGRLFEIGDRSRTMTAMRAVRRQPRAIFDLWRHRAREATLTVSGHPLGRWPGLLWHRWQHRRSLTLGGHSGAARMPAGRGGS